MLVAAPRATTWHASHRLLRIATDAPVAFVDITPLVEAAVREAALGEGFVNVQTRHTTTGILVNELEPLLLEDLRDLLERHAPSASGYRHDDVERRIVNLTPDERVNGHAHCKAALIGTSEGLNVSGGRLMLGRWQRVLLVECDGPREREVSLAFAGLAAVARHLRWDGRGTG
jgi:secondary thiamine-phosphate synthase enzyme